MAGVCKGAFTTESVLKNSVTQFSFLHCGIWNCILVAAIEKKVVERNLILEHVNPLVVTVVSYMGIMLFVKWVLLR